MPLKKGVTFSSSKTLKPGKSATVTIKWKKYLGKNLSDGKYRIYWAKNKVNKFTLKYTKIKTSVVSSSGSEIKLQITNNSNKDFKYTNSFKVKQYKKGKWKTVPLKKGVTFSSSKTLKPGKSATVTIKWKKYLGKNLSDEKYRIYWAKNKVNKFTLENTKIKNKIVSVSSKKIKLKLTNKSGKKFSYSKLFTLKKLEDGKWIKVQFGKNAMFPKCVFTVNPNKSVTETIVWKEYFDKTLSNGKYIIYWANTKVNAFTIK